MSDAKEKEAKILVEQEVTYSVSRTLSADPVSKARLTFSIDGQTIVNEAISGELADKLCQEMVKQLSTEDERREHFAARMQTRLCQK